MFVVRADFQCAVGAVTTAAENNLDAHKDATASDPGAGRVSLMHPERGVARHDDPVARRTFHRGFLVIGV